MRGFCIIPSHDGSYIVIGDVNSRGYDGSVIKIDDNGNLIWNKQYGSIYFDQLVSGQATNDGGYILVGTRKTSSGSYYYGWLLKIDADGNKRWEITEEAGSSDNFFTGIKQTSDGGYALLGWTKIKSDNSNSRVCLYKRDFAGKLISSHAFGDYQSTNSTTGSIIIESDGFVFLYSGMRRFYFDQNIRLVKTDLLGSQIGEEKCFGGTGEESDVSLLKDKNGGYIILGNTSSSQYSTGNRDAWLIKTDLNGNLEWEEAFGGAGMESSYGMIQDNDGNYVIVGTRNFQDFWCLVFTPKSTGVNYHLYKSPMTYQLLQNYPNPFNPVTAIEYQLPKDSYVSLKIFNMNGELVKICLEGKQSSGYHNIQWDGRDENGNSVPAGVYLYRLKSDGFSQSNKMILIR
jgi:hypothetical protein